MSFRETLELLLNADASGGIAEVRKFASESSKSVSEVESHFKKLGGAALKIGGSGMAAGGFLTALGDKERQAAEGLKASIQAAGQSYDEFEGKIEHAVKGQEQFGHTADETNNALSTLVSSFGDTNQALDKMQLVADLAAKKHISLADAATIVAKAHGGAGRIFKEFNIQIGLNADGTKNYDGALTELSGKLTGQASASVSGFTGHLKILATQAEDFIAGVGKDWGPAILGLSTGLTALGGVMTGVGSGLDWLKARRLADVAATEAQTTANSAEAVSTLYEAEAIGMSKVAMLGAAGGAIALGAALYYGATHSTDFSYNMENIVHAATDLKGANLDKAVRDIVVITEAAGKSMHDFGEEMASKSIPAANAFADSMDRNGQNSTDFRQGIADNVVALQDQKTASEASAAALDGMTLEQKKAADATKAQHDALVALNDASQKEIDLADQRVGGAIALSNAQIAERKSIDDLTKSNKDGKLSVDEHATALNNAESAIMSEGQAAKDLAAKQAAATGATDAAKVSLQAQIAELQGVAAQLDPSSPLRVWLDQYIATLKSTPTSINTDFSISGPGGGPGLVKVGSGGVVHSAGGQRNFRGGLSWVGENGPELVDIPRGSNVYTNRESKSMGGLSISIGNLSVVAPSGTSDPAAFGRAVAEGLEAHLRSNGVGGFGGATRRAISDAA